MPKEQKSVIPNSKYLPMQMFDTFKKMNLLEFTESSKCDD